MSTNGRHMTHVQNTLVAASRGKPPTESYRKSIRSSTLAVRCWCELRIVGAPASDVRRGLTLPCESEACAKMDEEARTDG